MDVGVCLFVYLGVGGDVDADAWYEGEKKQKRRGRRGEM